MSSTLRQKQIAQQSLYLSKMNFYDHIFTYNYNLDTNKGTLGKMGIATSHTCSGLLLKTNGRKLLPDVNPGVSTMLLMVGFAGKDGHVYTGFIDPTQSQMFRPLS